ncbi:MAG: glycosyltransferase, partial [Myxococcota bacterium]|nr:glycosyltransferase [Myxococcota bacterium]
MIVGMPTTSFPRYVGDVSGCFVLGMARALAARGHRIEVIAPEPDRDLEGRPPWTQPSPGVSVRWVPYARPRALQRTFHRDGAPDNLARDPLAWIGALSWPFALARAIDEGAARWDVIASHWGVPSGLIAAARRGRCGHVAFFHSADVAALARVPRVGA